MVPRWLDIISFILNSVEFESSHSQLLVHSTVLSICLLKDKLLKPSKLAEMSVSGGAACLTLPHLAKDDEGLYTLRIFTKDGTAEHSAYLFVSGTKNSVLCVENSITLDT